MKKSIFTIGSKSFYLLLSLFLLLTAVTESRAQQSYCQPANTDPNGQGSYIANVTFGAINYTPTTLYPVNGFSYITSQTTTVIIGSNENLSVSIDPGGGSYLGAIISVWFDWNQDGVFSASEWTQVATNAPAGTTVTVPITIPPSAMSGVTRMRVRTRGTGNQNGAGDACTSMGSGTSYDFDITVSPGAPCTGTPSPGTFAASVPDSVCANIGFGLTMTGSTFGSGITYQWQSSATSGGPWTDISGATNLSYNVTSGITSTTYYRLGISCNAGPVQYSSEKKISVKPVSECYCTPTYTYDCTSGDLISNVTLEGESVVLNNSTACNGNGTGYTYFNTLPKPDLAPGNSYDVSVATSYSSPTYEQVKVWIDYNKNGVFEASELIAHTNGAGLVGGSTSFNFTVPTSLAAGDYRMRVRMVYGGTSTTTFDACGNESFGETEDYLVNIIQLSDCTAPVTAGLVADTMTVCGNIPFTIATVGATAPANGQAGQWQSSPAGANTWTNITNATSVNYNVASGILVATDFRYIITCSLTNTSDTSNVMEVTLKPGVDCYCTPENNYSSSYYISNVTTTGALTNINKTSGFSTNGYANYTGSDTLVVYNGQTINYSVSSLISGYYNYSMWIDWDQNGDFNGVGESVGSTYGNSMTGNFTGSFTVPATAPLGYTRLRVRNSYIYDPASCDDDDYGEVEDYTVWVYQLSDCSGMPTAGVVADTMSVCPLNPFELLATGTTAPATGLTGQWQSSPAGANTWTNISNANLPSYIYAAGISVATDFRFIYTCSISGLADTSSIMEVSLKSATECYCIPTYNTACDVGDDISNVKLEGESITLNNPTGCSPAGYGDYTSMAAPDLAPGNSYDLKVSTSYGSPNYEDVKAWIDYNLNGTFEPGEEIANTNGNGLSASGTSTFNFTVPNNTAAGNYRMRVRLVYSSGTFDPCSNEYYGETEDYMVSIIQLSDCAGTPSAGSVTDSMLVCPSTAIQLTATGVSAPANGQSGQWQSSPAGANTWTNISNAFSANYTYAAGVMVETEFRYILTCSISNQADTSDVIYVELKPTIECYCEVNSTSVNYGIGSFSTTGALTNVNNVTSGGSYTDYSDSLFVAQNPGGTVNFTIASASGSAGMGIWIDWNQNGSFYDSGEQVYNAGTYVTTGSGSFTVPVNQTPGNYRMRVVANWLSTNPIPCDDLGNISYGEAEDYTFTVIALCDTPVLSLGIDTFMCSGSSITLDVGAANAGFDIEWNDGSTNQTLTVNTGGTYYVSVADDICVATDTIVITEIAGPTATEIDVTTTGGCNYSFELLNESGATEYSWDFGDGSPLNNSATPSHSYTANGVYTVSVTISNICGSETFTKQVECDDGTGIGDINIDNKVMKLYPNPTADFVTIENNSQLNMETITVMNVLGQVVYKDAAQSSTKHRMNVSKLASGVYTVQIQTNEGVVIRKFEVLK